MKRGQNTKKRILETGLRMWLENHEGVNAHAISKRIGMNHATVLYHFPEGVKDAVAQHALDVKNTKVVAQLIATGHKVTENLSPSERMDYLKKSCHSQIHFTITSPL